MFLNLILFCPPLGSFQFVYVFPEVWRRTGQSTSVRLCLYWDKSSGITTDLVVLTMLLLVHLRKTFAVFGARCLLSLSPESVTVFASYCTFCVCAFFLPTSTLQSVLNFILLISNHFSTWSGSLLPVSFSSKVLSTSFLLPTDFVAGFSIPSCEPLVRWLNRSKPPLDLYWSALPKW